MTRRIRFALGMLGYFIAPLGVLLVVARGSEEDLIWVVVLVVVALVSLTVIAVQPRANSRKVALGLALAGALVALLCVAVLGGRKLFASQVITQLPAYQAVADAELVRLSREPKRYVRQGRPHPDLAWADATMFEDGGSLVRLAFQRAPRTMILLLPSKHALPRFDESGRCLETLSGDWQWYVRC